MKNRSVDIKFQDSANNNFSFTQLSDLHEFLNQEMAYWKSAHEAIERAGNNAEDKVCSHSQLGDSINNLELFMNGSDNLTEDQFASTIHNFTHTYIRQLSGGWLWSKSSISIPYIECNKVHGKHAAANFINLILYGRATFDLNGKDNLIGAVSAYEFLMQGSEIVSRRRSERISLGKLRSELFERKQNLDSEIEEIKNNYGEWDNEARETAHKIQRIVTKLAARQRKMQESKFRELTEKWSDNVRNLEHSYAEKLKLSKPAEYWKESARKYACHGYWWIGALTLSLAFGVWLFYRFFTTWLQGAELAIELQSLQGIILFGTGATVYAYIVRVLSKLVFSSFHLMRDAQEREQLTYLYLALSKETDVDEASRQIVLQALFSRSETGLLAQEHGPTMPSAADGLRKVMGG